MDQDFYRNIEELLRLEKENVKTNTILLQSMMDSGVKNIDQLDRVADRLLDSMHGLSGDGEDMYHKYLDYMSKFNPKEANERRDDLEYDLGYKTHVLYAAAILCKKELEKCFSPNGGQSFQVVMNDYIPKVFEIKKKAASFIFFAHYASGLSVEDLMKMLRTITEEPEYILERVEEFDDLMCFPREIYHPLREDEWQFIQTVADLNIKLCNEHPKLKEDIMNKVFGKSIVRLFNY